MIKKSHLIILISFVIIGGVVLTKQLLAATASTDLSSYDTYRTNSNGLLCKNVCQKVEPTGCTNGAMYCTEYKLDESSCEPPVRPPLVFCGGPCSPTESTCPLECPVCNPNGTGRYVCGSAPTPTPTIPPSCGSPCSGNYVCQGAKDGCTVCIDSKCSPPPPTPTATPTASPVPTNTPTPTSPPPTPTATPTASPVPSPTATPKPSPSPTATPTPSPTPFPFDNSMCQCDDIKKPLDAISLGNPFTVTAYGKVMGINKNYAKIPTFTFTFYKGSGNIVELVKPAEKVNTTIIEETAEKTRYQAVWTLDLSGIDKSQMYRIQAHPDCSRKAAISYFNADRVVLGSSDVKPQGFWDKIASFIFGLLGGKTSSNVNQITASTPTPTLTVEQRRNLQLKTFTPAKNVETGLDANNCTFIKFSF